MSERPILFSGELVRAILERRKWQTRRVVTPQPPPECSINYPLGNESWLPQERRTPLRHHWEAWHGELYRSRPEGHLCGSHGVRCPYGQPAGPWHRFGDAEPQSDGWYDVWWPVDDEPRLVYLRYTCEGGGWVWGRDESDDPEAIELDIREPDEIRWREPGDRLWVRERMRVIGRGPATARADSIRVRYEADGVESGVLPYPARLSHEPQIGRCLPYGGFREASRIDLEVTGVRVERVQDISGADVIAEGVDPGPHRCGCEACGTTAQLCPATESGLVMEFARLWDSINGKRYGCSWADSPWVWVVEFRVLDVQGAGATRRSA